jgi:hypothetical protein
MTRQALSQPLPMDLRDYSFRGTNCEGWDFSGRDIRGCDFRTATLTGANFSRAIAGRSPKQTSTDITIAVAIILALVVALAITTRAITEFPVGAAIGVTVAGVIAGKVSDAGNAGGTFGVAGGSAIVIMGVGASIVVVASMLISEGKTSTEVILGAMGGLFVLYMGCLSFKAAIKEFKNATGTNFENAALKGVNFSYSELNNCSFRGADTSLVNWTGAKVIRTSIDVEHKQI